MGVQLLQQQHRCCLVFLSAVAAGREERRSVWAFSKRVRFLYQIFFRRKKERKKIEEKDREGKGIVEWFAE